MGRKKQQNTNASASKTSHDTNTSQWGWTWLAVLVGIPIAVLFAYVTHSRELASVNDAQPTVEEHHGGLHGNPWMFTADRGSYSPDFKKIDDPGHWLAPPSAASAASQEEWLVAKRSSVRKGKAVGLPAARRQMNKSFLQDELARMSNSNDRWDAFCMLSGMEVVPKFTKKGYHMRKIPAKVYEEMRDWFDQHISEASLDKYEKHGIEPFQGDWKSANGIYYRHPYQPLYLMQPLDQAEKLMNTIKPIVEKFAGTKVQIMAHHGFRVYLRTNFFPFHIDNLHTKVFGVILHVRHHHDHGNSWPLEIYNHATDKFDTVSVEEGDMVIYEAIGNPHARPVPLRGDYHANVFFHFAPLEWNYDSGDVVKQVNPDWNIQAPGQQTWIRIGRGHYARNPSFFS